MEVLDRAEARSRTETIEEFAPETLEKANLLASLTPEKAVMVVQDRFPLARLEHTPLNLQALAKRCNEVYGEDTKIAFESVIYELPNIIVSISGENGEMEAVGNRMLRAAQILLDTIPKDPLDLIGQGSHGTQWWGALTGPDGFITSVIVSAIRSSLLSFEHQITIIDNLSKTIPEINRLDAQRIQDSCRGVVLARRFLINRQGKQLFRETELDVAHAFSRLGPQAHLMLSNRYIDQCFLRLRTHEAVVALFVDSTVQLEILRSENNHRCLSKQVDSVTQRIRRKELTFENRQQDTDQFERGYFEAKIALWWLIRLGGATFYYNSLRHRLGDLAVYILDHDLYSEVAQMRAEGLSLRVRRDDGTTEKVMPVYTNNKAMMLAWAQTILIRGILEDLQIPGIAAITGEDGRVKGTWPVAWKWKANPSLGDGFPGRPLYTRSAHQRVTSGPHGFDADLYQKYSHDEVGTATHIVPSPEANLIAINSYAVYALEELGFIIPSVNLEYAIGGPYQAVHWNIGIPVNFTPGRRAQRNTELANELEYRLIVAHPFTQLYGHLHELYELNTKWGLSGPQFSFNSAIGRIAAARRLEPGTRYLLAERFPAIKVTTRIAGQTTQVDISPAIDDDTICLQGGLLIDAVYPVIEGRYPREVSNIVIKLLLSPLYTKLEKTLSPKSAFSRPVSEFLGRNLIVQAVTDQALGIGEEESHLGIEVELLLTVKDYFDWQEMQARQLQPEHFAQAQSILPEKDSSQRLINLRSRHIQSVAKARSKFEGRTRELKDTALGLLMHIHKPKFIELLEDLGIEAPKSAEQLFRIGARVGDRDLRETLSEDELHRFRESLHTYQEKAQRLPKLMQRLAVASARQELILEGFVEHTDLVYLVRVAVKACSAVREIIYNFILDQVIDGKINEEVLATIANEVTEDDEGFYQHPVTLVNKIALDLAQLGNFDINRYTRSRGTTPTL